VQKAKERSSLCQAGRKKRQQEQEDGEEGEKRVKSASDHSRDGTFAISYQ
jgi:hypothetical protein